jgi:hypothetical protein
MTKALAISHSQDSFVPENHSVLYDVIRSTVLLT